MLTISLFSSLTYEILESAKPRILQLPMSQVRCSGCMDAICNTMWLYGRHFNSTHPPLVHSIKYFACYKTLPILKCLFFLRVNQTKSKTIAHQNLHNNLNLIQFNSFLYSTFPLK